MSISRTAPPLPAAIAAAQPAAYPTFCTSGCIRTGGRASRRTLSPMPITSMPLKSLGSRQR